MTIPSFSDPRIDAVLKQIREAETLQVIARLRLVWAMYQKRVFLLSNLPVEMPVDHLIQFEDENGSAKVCHGSGVIISLRAT